MSRAIESLKFGHWQRLSSPPVTMEAGKLPRILKLGAITKAYRGGFLIFVLVFVSRDFEVGSK